MGGVRVVEYQRIDIIEQRPDARPSRVSLSLRWLLACWLCPAVSSTNSNPLNGRSRDLAYSILGLSLQTAAGVSWFAWRPASRAATRHPASIQLCARAGVSSVQHQKGAPAASSRLHAAPLLDMRPLAPVNG
jgi:hypothetical protein